MSNILRRTTTPQAQAVNVRDPWQALRQFMNRASTDLWPSYDSPWPVLEASGEFVPSFDVKDTKEGYEIKADLPGVKEQDLDVTVQGQRLKVSGKREVEKEEKTDTYYSCERAFGSFARVFTLPEDANTAKVHADLSSGVLKILVPRTAEAPVKKIPVKN